MKSSNDYIVARFFIDLQLFRDKSVSLCEARNILASAAGHGLAAPARHES
jgi:hypothetical protein